MKNKYTKEEIEILEGIEGGKYKSVENISRRKTDYETFAKNTMKKDKRVNIRISEKDLTSLQRIAVEEGIPYQTLISSLLHKYINGNLVDRNMISQTR